MNAVSINMRKVIVASILTVMLGGASLAGLANGNNPDGGHNSAAVAEVKYIPGPDGEGVFNVQYDNPAGSRFSLQIADVEGNFLYQDIFTEKKFDRNFKLADPDSFHKIVFIIRNLKDNSFQRFEVEASTHLVEEVNVQEIK